MKLRVDYLLIGTGAAPLLAAQKLTARGDSVMILNPDSDFFLENSELSLDLLSFESNTTDLSRRFANNFPEQVYRDLIPEFPGAVEIAREEDLRRSAGPYQVAEAPWIRSRHRLWVAPERGVARDRLEVLYLRALDLGLKPQWLEGLPLAKRFPGFSFRDVESRNLDGWVGFVGPRLGDIDVSRYRTGLLEFVRERLGRENVMTGVHLLNADQKGVRFQKSEGLPKNIEVGRAVLFFWTPKLDRMLRQNLERHFPRGLKAYQESASLQRWEEWDLLSRDPVNPFLVAHLERVRIWAHGEGPPPAAGWNQIKVMMREKSDTWVDQESFDELSRLVFQFMGWDRFTVRKMTPRALYRWNGMTPIEYETGGLRTLIIPSCDGPLHWIAGQVRKTIDGV